MQRNTLHTKKKQFIILILNIFYMNNALAWNRQVIPTESVKADNGTIRYTQHQAGGGWENSVDFASAAPKQIGWDTGGICIDAYKIEMITGKYAGEVIMVQNPRNACDHTTLYLATPEEAEKFKVGRPNSLIFKGSQGKLTIFMP